MAIQHLNVWWFNITFQHTWWSEDISNDITGLLNTHTVVTYRDKHLLLSATWLTTVSMYY